MGDERARALCRYIKKEYGVIPYRSWGALDNQFLRLWWDSNGCNTVADIGDQPCAGTSVPGGVVEGIQAQAKAPLKLGSRTLQWEDNFDGDTVSERWYPETFEGKPGPYNQEVQVYTANNFYVRNSCLKIEGRKESWGGYTSSRLITRDKFSFTEGTVVVRARMNQAVGSWPAIWTLGVGEWPLCGEIDLMEYAINNWGRNRPQSAVQTQEHYYATAGFVSNTVGVRDATDWNEWMADVSSERVEVWCNGERVLEYKNEGRESQYPFGKSPQYLVMNVALGGTCGGIIDDSTLPARLEVDWIRFYQ
jgi:beta-glucanase (GH16 family)